MRRNDSDRLNGAWEERGVIGTRIEIDRKHITVLWRNAPVLQTTFRTRNAGEKTILILKKTGLRYVGATNDYADVTEIALQDDRLIFTKHFPITGESTETLEKTDRSRFGDVRFADKEILPLLQGVWTTPDRSEQLSFSKDRFTFNGQTVSVHILQSNDPGTDPTVYRIADADPAHYELLFFANMCYHAGEITAMIPVCDAPSVILHFHKRSNP